jgi:hypothetical protein
MELENRIREVQGALTDAARCARLCPSGSMEALAFSHIIHALEGVLGILRSLSRPGNRGGAAAGPP